MYMEFKQTMVAGEEEFKPRQQEELTLLDEQILEINNEITKALNPPTEPNLFLHA